MSRLLKDDGTRERCIRIGKAQQQEDADTTRRDKIHGWSSPLTTLFAIGLAHHQAQVLLDSADCSGKGLILVLLEDRIALQDEGRRRSRRDFSRSQDPRQQLAIGVVGVPLLVAVLAGMSSLGNRLAGR